MSIRSSYFIAMNNQVDVITSPKGWTESSRTSANAASYRSQSNTAIASSVNSNKNTITSVKLANSNSTAFTSETVTNTRTKGKKDDPTSKKSSASLTQTVLKNDDLSKWGIKALSNLKPSFDGKQYCLGKRLKLIFRSLNLLLCFYSSYFHRFHQGS